MPEDKNPKKEYKSKDRREKYSEEDRFRMSRLGEEVTSRLTEMSRIVARTLGEGSELPARYYTVNLGTTDAPLFQVQFLSQPIDVSDIDVEFDIVVGCHCEVNKMSCMGPCPCQ